MSTYTTQTKEKFYIYDRLDNSIKIFSSKAKFINYLVEKCLRWYKPDGIEIDNIVSEQNFSGNDTTRHVMYETTIDEYGERHSYMVNNYTLRRFTFYIQVNNLKPHIIDIKEYINEILTEKRNYYSNRRKNWCKERRYKPYQRKGKHGKNDRYGFDKELMEEFNIKPASRRKRGLDKNPRSVWARYYSDSERCWKKQTKNRHQYGDYNRDKKLETYLILNNLKTEDFEIAE